MASAGDVMPQKSTYFYPKLLTGMVFNPAWRTDEPPMVQAIKRDEAFIEPEGIHVETHQPERRSRKPPLLLIHGALTGSWLWTEFAAYLAERGWEAHAMNLRGHFTSDVAELGETTCATMPTTSGSRCVTWAARPC